MKLLSNLSLQQRFGIFVLLGVLLGTGVFGFLSIQALSRSTEARLQERLAIARLVADREDEVLGSALSIIETTVRSPALEPDSPPPKGDIASMEMALSALAVSVYNILLIDEKGTVIWEKGGPPPTPGESLYAYASVRNTLSLGKSSVSDLILIPGTQTPVILLSSVYPISQLAIRGALVVAIDLSRSNIVGFSLPIKLGETGYAEIVDAAGIVLARTEPGRPPLFFEKSDHPERFASLIASREPTVGTCHRCHVGAEQTERRRDVLAFAPVSQASWGVIIRQSEEEALAPTRELQQRLLIAGLTLFVISMLLVWLATSDIVSRLKSLKLASSRMAGGDLSTPIPSSGKDEVGTLALALDSTRARLKASHEEVGQRTKELASLLAISQIRAATTDFAVLLHSMTEKVVATIEPADSAALLLYDEEARHFEVQSVIGLDPAPSLQGMVIPAAPNSVQDIANSGKACLLISELPLEVRELLEAACSRFLETKPLHPAHGSAICAPLLSKTRLLGGIILISHKGLAPFSNADCSLLQAMANEIATGVENIHLSRQAEEARVLRETDRLKSEFISTVSHELRTPLTSIKGCATSLMRQDVEWDAETRQEFIQAIDEKADELRDLIDKLLQMARVEAGALQIRREPVLINHMAEKIIAEIAQYNPRHSFIADFPDSFPIIEADSSNIGIILRNLVENAVKYSPQGGQVTVAGKVAGDKVIISVADQGIGIPARYLSRIFERFYRVESEVIYRVSGSGLGLSVVKALVEAHEGGVWVESQEGRGSSFYFSLPMEARDGKKRP